MDRIEQIALVVAEKTSVYMLGKNYHEQGEKTQEYLLSLGESIACQICGLEQEPQYSVHLENGEWKIGEPKPDVSSDVTRTEGRLLTENELADVTGEAFPELADRSYKLISQAQDTKTARIKDAECAQKIAEAVKAERERIVNELKSIDRGSDDVRYFTRRVVELIRKEALNNSC